MQIFKRHEKNFSHMKFETVNNILLNDLPEFPSAALLSTDDTTALPCFDALQKNSFYVILLNVNDLYNETRRKGQNMDEFKVVRRHMRFTGRVQGVGFRYRAKYAANGMGITGWAKNEWDGSVEMEAQGTIAQINMMLKMINKSDYIVIDTIDTKDIPLEEHETGFYVSYSDSCPLFHRHILLRYS